MSKFDSFFIKNVNGFSGQTHVQFVNTKIRKLRATEHRAVEEHKRMEVEQGGKQFIEHDRKDFMELGEHGVNNLKIQMHEIDSLPPVVLCIYIMKLLKHVETDGYNLLELWNCSVYPALCEQRKQTARLVRERYEREEYVERERVLRAARENTSLKLCEDFSHLLL